MLQCNHTVHEHVSPSPKNITLFNAFLGQVLYRSHGPGSLHLQIYARTLSALKHLHQDRNGKNAWRKCCYSSLSLHYMGTSASLIDISIFVHLRFCRSMTNPITNPSLPKIRVPLSHEVHLELFEVFAVAKSNDSHGVRSVASATKGCDETAVIWNHCLCDIMAVYRSGGYRTSSILFNLEGSASESFQSFMLRAPATSPDPEASDWHEMGHLAHQTLSPVQVASKCEIFLEPAPSVTIQAVWVDKYVWRMVRSSKSWWDRRRQHYSKDNKWTKGEQNILKLMSNADTWRMKSSNRKLCRTKWPTTE